jgi:uncharacterized protein YjbI with pentapeptide repeats
LPNLDAVRKGLVIDYLYGSDVLLRVDALLYGADLRAADLNGRFLSEADLSGANLREANLSGADLSKTDLSGANLGGADLSFANLFEAGIDDKTQIDPKWKLVRDIVTDGAEGRTDLSKADLSRANLSFVNLRGADLREVNLKEANLREAKYDNDTDWPDGFDPKAAGAILVE